MFSKIAHRFAVTAVAAVVGLTSGVAYAESKKTVINASTVTTYPPHEFRDTKTNQLMGFDIDLVNAMAAKIGAKVNWTDSNFDQLYSSLASRRADLIVAALHDRPERRGTASFVDYFQDNAVFYTLRANASRFSSADAICGKTVAVTRSVAIWNSEIVKWSEANCVKAGKPAVTILGTENAPNSRLQLNQNRADLAVQSSITLAYQNTVEDNRYVTVGTPFYSAIGAFGFNKDDVEFGQALKKALNELIADGTYHKLMRKWNIPDGSAIKQAMINGQP